MPGRIILNVRSDGTVFTATGGCLTQTTDVDQSSISSPLAMFASETHGQSWTCGISGPLYSISFYRYAGTAATVTIRVDDDDVMSSEYILEGSVVAGTSEGWVEWIIPAASRPTLTATNLYYFYMISDTTIDIAYDNTDPYASGDRYYVATPAWEPLIRTTTDLTFRIKMCD